MSFQTEQGWQILKICAKIIQKRHSIREKTTRVTVGATFKFLKNQRQIYDNISIRGKTMVKIFGSFFIDYFMNLENTSTSSAIRQRFPAQFFVKFDTTGTLPGTSDCEGSLILNLF